MVNRHKALAITAAIMGAALAGVAALPQAAAAQVYDDAPARPFSLHRQADIDLYPDQGRVDDGDDFGGSRPPKAYPDRRPRDLAGRDDGLPPRGWHRPPHGFGDPRWDDGDRRWDRGDVEPGYGARFDRPRGPGFPEQPYGPDPYEEVAVPAVPAVDIDRRGPDVGCTIQRSETTTAVGWRKIVTHKTCYQR